MTATEARRRLSLIPARVFLAAAVAFAGFAVIGVAIAQDSPGGPCTDPDCLKEGGEPIDDDGTGGSTALACPTWAFCPDPTKVCTAGELAWCCAGPGGGTKNVCTCALSRPTGCTVP